MKINLQVFVFKLLFLFPVLFISSIVQSQVYIDLDVDQPERIQANAGDDLTICEGDFVEIGGNPAATDGTDPYTYSWSPNSTLSDPSSANPTASPESTVEYILTVTDANGCTDSDSFTVTVESCANIENHESNITTNVFPNPNNGTFTLVVEASETISNLNIQIVNVLGQVIHDEEVNSSTNKYEKELNIQPNKQGVYLINIKSEKSNTTKKIIVE